MNALRNLAYDRLMRFASDSALKTLYVSRPLVNADAFRSWAKDQGFKNIEEDLHVTIAFSKTPMDWDKTGDSVDDLRVTTTDGRRVKQLGTAIVLRFKSEELTARWSQIKEAGASWDFDSYQPHVSITYDLDVDLDKVTPFDGPLEFGPERFEEIKETADDADQPRDGDGKFAAVSSLLKKAVPELAHFKEVGPKLAGFRKGHMRSADPHHYLMASTENGKLGVPVTIPGHESASGIAIKINPNTKHIHFQELNSHIKGAGRKMVDTVMQHFSDHKFSVTDWSNVGKENHNGPSFWDKVKQKHSGKFGDDSMIVTKTNDKFFAMANDKAIGPFATQELAQRAAALIEAPLPTGLANDKSGRMYDADGRMHHEESRISKACVSPYFGREIPGCKELGLDPNKIYKLLRDPAELEKAASTFNNLPLLEDHEPTSAEDHPQNMVIGTTGSQAKYVHPYLVNSLAIWTQDAIDGVEANKQKELSSSYYYKPDMTAGEYEGEKYDGVMRDIVGNHVALIPKGRAGPDVAVGDSALQHKEIDMTNVLSRTAIRIHGALLGRGAPLLLAQDKALDFGTALATGLKGVTYKNVKDKKAAIIKMAKDALDPLVAPEAKAAGGMGPDDIIDKLIDLVIAPGAAETPQIDAGAAPVVDPVVDPADAGDDAGNPELMAFLKTLGLDDEALAKVAAMLGGSDEGEVVDDEELDEDGNPIKKANDEKDDPTMKPDTVTKAAMDAAIKKTTADVTKAIKADALAVAEAREYVRPWVGNVAMAHDSVPAIYQAALSSLGVDAKDVADPAALKHILNAQKKAGAVERETEMANDSLPSASIVARLPHVANIRIL